MVRNPPSTQSRLTIYESATFVRLSPAAIEFSRVRTQGGIGLATQAAYLGICNPGDESHSLIREPMSHRRARRNSVSRATPGWTKLASSRRLIASIVRRSSSVVARLICLRCIALLLALHAAQLVSQRPTSTGRALAGDAGKLARMALVPDDETNDLRAGFCATQRRTTAEVQLRQRTAVSFSVFFALRRKLLPSFRLIKRYCFVGAVPFNDGHLFRGVSPSIASTRPSTMRKA